MKRLMLIILLLFIFTFGGFAQSKGRIAVLDLYTTGVSEATKKSIEEALTTWIISYKTYRVVERSQIDKVFAELSFSNTDEFSAESAAEIGEMLGAEKVLIGSVTRDKGVITVYVRLIDVQTGLAALAKGITISNNRMIDVKMEELAYLICYDREMNRLYPINRAGIGLLAGGGTLTLSGAVMLIIDFAYITRWVTEAPTFPIYSTRHDIDMAMFGVSVATLSLGIIALAIGFPLTFIKPNREKNISFFMEGTLSRPRIGIQIKLPQYNTGGGLQ